MDCDVTSCSMYLCVDSSTFSLILIMSKETSSDQTDHCTAQSQYQTLVWYWYVSLNTGGDWLVGTNHPAGALEASGLWKHLHLYFTISVLLFAQIRCYSNFNYLYFGNHLDLPHICCNSTCGPEEAEWDQCLRTPDFLVLLVLIFITFDYDYLFVLEVVFTVTINVFFLSAGFSLSYWNDSSLMTLPGTSRLGVLSKFS